MVEGLLLIPRDARASQRYGAIRAELERRGTPLGANDCWMATQTLSLGVMLVTDKVGVFSRLKGLPLDNWLEEGGSSGQPWFPVRQGDQRV